MQGMVDAAEPSAILPDDIGALKSIIGVQTLEIERLKEELRLAQHKRFGASSEKFDPDQFGLFDEAETLSQAPDAGAAADGSTEITIAEHKRAKGGRKPLSDALPRVRVEHDIPEREKLCPCGSGHARPRIGEMISEQADIVPATVKCCSTCASSMGRATRATACSRKRRILATSLRFRTKPYLPRRSRPNP